jgi:hypothetical protein
VVFVCTHPITSLLHLQKALEEQEQDREGQGEKQLKGWGEKRGEGRGKEQGARPTLSQISSMAPLHPAFYRQEREDALEQAEREAVEGRAVEGRAVEGRAEDRSAEDRAVKGRAAKGRAVEEERRDTASQGVFAGGAIRQRQGVVLRSEYDPLSTPDLKLLPSTQRVVRKQREQRREVAARLDGPHFNLAATFEEVIRPSTGRARATPAARARTPSSIPSKGNVRANALLDLASLYLGRLQVRQGPPQIKSRVPSSKDSKQQQRVRTSPDTPRQESGEPWDHPQALANAHPISPRKMRALYAQTASGAVASTRATHKPTPSRPPPLTCSREGFTPTPSQPGSLSSLPPELREHQASTRSETIPAPRGRAERGQRAGGQRVGGAMGAEAKASPIPTLATWFSGVADLKTLENDNVVQHAAA